MEVISFGQAMETGFDDSVSLIAQAVIETFDADALVAGSLIRDASGTLTFVYPGAVTSGATERFLGHLEQASAHYVRPERPIISRDQPAVGALLRDAPSLVEMVQIGDTKHPVTVFDRRIVGADWLTRPTAPWMPPDAGRLVFSSLKGGVGRSTALAVLAADLAYQNRRVLVVDLDLEAPGIGSMLISREDRPQYGLIDWLVESNLRDLDETFLEEMTAPSRIAEGRGLIEVVPATGRCSDIHPHNVLSKLSRAYIEDTRHDVPTTFLGKCNELIQKLSARKQYDAILIDARAGLHESTATPILGLGADVLFFGIDTTQTFDSYEYLLSHLAKLTMRVEDPASFVTRMRFVHAKASKDHTARVSFRDKVFELFSRTLYPLLAMPTEAGIDLLDSFSLDSEEAPHFAWPVYASTDYVEFDPLRHGKANQLERSLYEESYGEFLNSAWERLQLQREH